MSFFERFKKKAGNDAFEILDNFNRGKRIAEEGLSHRTLGDFDEALRKFKTALSEYGYFPAITLIGTTYSIMGGRSKAIEWFKVSIENERTASNKPVDFLVELYANLASLYHLDGRVDLAGSANDAALVISDDMPLSPERDMVRSAIFRNLALLSCESGDAKSADELFRKRLEVVPYCEISRRHLPVVRKAWYVPFKEQNGNSPFGEMVFVTAVKSITLLFSSIPAKNVARVCGFFEIEDPLSDMGIDTIISSVSECLDRGLYENPRRSGDSIIANSLVSYIELLKRSGFNVSLFPCPLDKETIKAVSSIISTFDVIDNRLSK